MTDGTDQVFYIQCWTSVQKTIKEENNEKKEATEKKKEAKKESDAPKTLVKRKRLNCGGKAEQLYSARWTCARRYSACTDDCTCQDPDVLTDCKNPHTPQ